MILLVTLSYYTNINLIMSLIDRIHLSRQVPTGTCTKDTNEEIECDIYWVVKRVH